MSDTLPPLQAEWLEGDGHGGFASGTVGGFRTRRYHALLLSALRPPAQRRVLVNGFEAWLHSGDRHVPLSTQHYDGGVVHPRGVDQLHGFEGEPWPQWRFRFGDGATVHHQCLVDPVDGSVVLSWRLGGGPIDARLEVRPLLSGRDFHALMRENPDFDFAARSVAGNACWRPYPALPGIAALSNGAYVHAPLWFRQFHYAEEAARGLDAVEDLASPGGFHFDLNAGEAFMVLRVGENIGVDAAALARRIRDAEAIRRKALPPRARSASVYAVRRGPGASLIAGYPWFGDWGRDTFIAMRGLTLAPQRLDLAGALLGEWAGHVSAGMLPNRFPDDGGAPEYGSVDAALWFVVVVHEFLAAGRPRRALRERLQQAVQQVVDAYASGTRHGIRMDGDGLLACGVPGRALTWMDAVVDGTPVTPRIGKPVEVQALWINALRAAGRGAAAERALGALRERFWNEDARCLFDVVDVDHVPGRNDAALRPNQILAVGGLPVALLEGDRAAAVVDKVQRELLTPLGLRSLAPSDAAYIGRYEGGPAQRDRAYHQGTVWPWLIGPFVEAWLRVHGDDAARRGEIHARCLQPLLDHLGVAGLGHVSEIADGDAPHTPRGCPFQAWSLGELQRALALTRDVNSEAESSQRPGA